MTTEITALVAIVLANLIMGGASRLWVPAWKKRGYDDRPIRWNLLIIISALIGMSVGAVAFLGSENWATSTAVSIVGYLAVFSSTVDILLLRIPSEPTKLAGLLGAILFLAALPTVGPENYMSLVFWGLVLVVFGVCSWLRYLGDGDMKIFTAFFFLLAWWMPPNDMTASMIVLVVFGFITRGLAAMFNIGVDKSVAQQTKWNPETQKMEALDTSQQAGDVHEAGRAEKRKTKSKNRKFFPFGPAILVSFLGVAIFSSYNSIIVPAIDLPF